MTEKEKELTHEMLDLIERIKNKTDTLNTNNRIPELELNVILATIEKLHQKAIVLRYLHQNADELYKPSQSDVKHISEENVMDELHEPVEAEIEQLSIKLNSIEEIVQEELSSDSLPIIDEKMEEKLMDELQEPHEVEIDQVTVNMGSIDDIAQKEQENLIDKIEADLANLGQPSVIETTQKPSGDLGSKLSQQPLADIKNGIGINDKFLYINELFGGNADQYYSMIEILNKLTSFTEAKEELQKLNLNEENETVQTFLNTVSRRYL